MYELNNAYEHFKVREQDLIRKANAERLAGRVQASTKKSNRNLAQMGHFLVKVGTHLVEAYDEVEITLSASSIHISGNEA